MPEDEETQDEPEEGDKGSEGNDAVATQVAETKPLSDELKIVLVLKGTRAMVGIQSPECDPVFTTLEGDLSAALSQVPALVDSAKAKWATNRRNPKAELPEPPAPPPAPSSSRSGRTTTTQTKKKVQPSFF